MADGAHFSDDKNNSGNPAVWRRIFYTDDLGDNNSVWQNGSYVDIYNDGHIGIYTSHIFNGMRGDTGGAPDASFVLEYCYMKKMLNGDKTIRLTESQYLIVFSNLPNGKPEDNFYMAYAPRADALANMSQSWGFAAYRKIVERPTGTPGANIPIPIPDIPGV
ncbi:hypothetical protein P0D69_28065 [Paraburkholderia sediminicola]|uniref:hypothetical protein n=1 Tax=Paraburkholderia sediminicola TaxID=458836 RepID=UPI0038BBCC36